MRSLLLIINVVVLITLGVFAKDNLMAEFRLLLSSDKSSKSKNVTAAGTIEVVFSPHGGATETIIKALSKAQKTILVSAYSFTSEKLAKALLDAKNRNVVVKLILDKSQVSQRYSSSTFFQNLGFDLRIDVKHAIFHNKVMIIDDNTVITGSFNFTKSAETKNAENVLIIHDNPSLARLYTENWRYHWNQSATFEEARKKVRKKLTSTGVE